MTTKTTAKTKTTREKAIEAGAKVPEDRAAKAEAKGDLIPVEIELDDVEGAFVFEINPDDLDDDEALEQFTLNMPARMFRNLTGDKENEFIERLRDERGRIRTSTKFEFVVKAMEAAKQGKS